MPERDDEQRPGEPDSAPSGPRQPEPVDPSGESSSPDLRSVDFTTESPPRIAREVTTRPYDPTRDREQKRGEIATSLIWILGGIFAATYILVIASGVVMIFKGTHPDFKTLVSELRTLMEPMLTAMTGLVGAVLGFYFGTKSRD